MATLTLTEITGSVKISLEKGSIRAAQITGDVDVTGHVDNVSIDEVSGAARLNGDFYEDIRLSKIAKGVIFKTSRSDMEIASVPGDIEIASDQVRGTDLMGPSRVSTGSKDIHLEDVSGDLQVQSTNGDVEVTTGGKAGGQAERGHAARRRGPDSRRQGAARQSECGNPARRRHPDFAIERRIPDHGWDRQR